MIAVSYDKELDVAIYNVEGDIVFSKIRDVLDNYYKGTLTKYTIGDYSIASQHNHLAIEQVKQLGQKVLHSSHTRPKGFDLIVAPSPIQHEFARVIRASSGITGQAFKKSDFKFIST